MAEPSLQATRTEQPKSAQIRIARSKTRELTDDERSELAIDLWSVWDTAKSARSAMNENLRAWSALYEMEVCETDWPWVGAANLVLPIIPAELDSMKSYIAGQVFVQRLIIVTPGDDDPETARLAPLVEKFYNAEIRRIRADGKTPIDHFKTILHLGLRDGGGPCDVFFSERVEPKLIVTDEPKIIDDNVVIDQDTGNPETERVMTRIEETIREVNITPRMMKDWYLVPVESTSIQTALGVMTSLWMTEKEMKEKVAEGTFKIEDVEQVLQWVVEGQSDVQSESSEYDKSAGGQINLGLGQGALVSKFFANRGPAHIVRLFSDQFDLDEDGIPEKNIFWFYARNPGRMLGHTEYEYADSSWPTFCFSPLPRPDRPYGYSLVERLADLAADACAGRNQRRNYIDLYLMPLLLEREGDTIRDRDNAFYPGARWTVEDPNNSIKWFQPAALSPDSFQDSADLNSWIAKLTGQNAPATGAQSSGRRTATETKQQQIAQTIRATDIAMDYRSFLRAVMQFWHKLNKQYLGASKEEISTYVPGELNKAYGGESKGGNLTLPPEVLSRNFNIDIAGLSDPVDASTRRTELMAAMGVMQKTFPWIFNDPEKSYNLAELFMDTFQFAAIERFIGTAEEAQQRKQAMQAQAQAAQPGAPGQPPGPPQPGAPPPNGAAPQPAGAPG